MFQYRSLRNQDTVSVQFETPGKVTSRYGRTPASKRTKLGILAGVVLVIVAAIVVMALTIGLRKKQAEDRSQNPPAYYESTDTPLMPTEAVQTECGKIIGVYENGAYVFKGIPYAEPPVDSLRWAPPVKFKECWQGIRTRAMFGFMCVQPGRPLINTEGMDEDCLFLNVWTPLLNPPHKLPVMVWFHDGNFMYGSGHDLDSSPSAKIAKQLNMVFVSFNYRLNIFGFLALKELRNPVTNTSGNYGLMDQIMALQWVQDNIENFGGDKNKVTVFGEEAGATSIYALLASPKAKGLFHKAWISGLSPIISTTMEQAEEDNKAFQFSSLCDPKSTLPLWQCLKQVSQEDLLELVTSGDQGQGPNWQARERNDLPEKGEKVGSLIVIDGDILPQSPMEMWKSNKTVMDIPLLIGNEAQEVDENPTPKDLDKWGWTEYKNYVKTRLDAIKVNHSQQVLEKYPFQETVEYQLTSMITDVRGICPTNEVAKLISQSTRSPVYRYVTGLYPSLSLPPVFYRHHAFHFHPRYSFRKWSMYGFYGFPKELLEKFKKSSTSRIFSIHLQQVVKQFVEAGIIIGGHSMKVFMDPKWETYPKALMAISANGIQEDSPSYLNYKDKCTLWINDEFYPKYSWKR